MTKLTTITFEGIDGSGKETQSKLLHDYLTTNGYKSVLISFPDYSTDLGKFIKNALQDKSFDRYALQMLFSADRLRQTPIIISNKDNFDFAILDRYKWSSLVYGCARGLNETWVKNLESVLPDPDFTFYIDISVYSLKLGLRYLSALGGKSAIVNQASSSRRDDMKIQCQE
jgi:dTMP kinase